MTYPLTCGPNQDPVNYDRICRSCKSQKYRKRLYEQCEVGNAAFNSMTLDDLTYIEAFFKIPLAKFIKFSANDCGYSDSSFDLIVVLIHTNFLNTKAYDIL